ncbi:MAG: TonB-dependent receptor [Bacteroidota bacterium]
MLRLLFLFLICLLLHQRGDAQDTLVAPPELPLPYFPLDSQVDTNYFPPIVVSVSRLATNWKASANAVTFYQAPTFQTLQQQVSLDEYLHQVPGLFSLNNYNRAQDLRIAIRGFGSRAAFGIRGIQLLIDGIPETTPDGQAQIDNLNLGIVSRIEVLRGPAAILHGNASGGVIQIQTLHGTQKNFVELGLGYGAFDWQQVQLLTGLRNARTELVWQGNYQASGGYRDYSDFSESNTNLRLRHRLSARSRLDLQVNYTNNPRARDPGSLTLEDQQLDRRAARPNNVLFRTGESIEHYKIGLSFRHLDRADGVWRSYAFYAGRHFEGALPFAFGGQVQLRRQYWGQGGNYSGAWQRGRITHRLQIGYDLAYQGDDRQRFFNLRGQRGDLTLDQLESFIRVAGFALYQFRYRGLRLSAGWRYDWNQLGVADRLGGGLADDQRQLNSWNPSVGLNYQLHSHYSVFANFRTGFETPTLSELSANPNGENGFNPDLEAQRSQNFELGLRYFTDGKWLAALNYYYIRSQRELVPFELAAFPDRSFFRNAGRSQRQGVELELQYRSRIWKMSLAYTFSDLRYRDYRLPDGDFSGNQLPGIPRHLLAWQGQLLARKGLRVQLRARYVGELYTNDANAVEDLDYLLANIQIGYHRKWKQYNFKPFLGVNNLLNVKYNDNIRINAFGQRYYESGPPLHLYGGLRVRWTQD